jgi:phosphoribosyl 1,2-cyclic phosphodiesterase
MLQVRFWGVRGSIPVPGPTTVGVGGNTSCVEVRCGKKLVILDAGTGIRGLGESLMARKERVEADIFFSHVHWDHIQGFPFFVPAMIPGNRLRLYGGRNVTATLEETLYGQMNFPNFPVVIGDLAARIEFHDLKEGEDITIGKGKEKVTVRNAKLNHPNGVFSYRIEYGGRSVVYATDTEHYSVPDPRLLGLAEKADVFIYDAQYTPEEYSGKTSGVARLGWGHSTMLVGAELAKLAGAKKLVLFHHDPSQDDAAVAEKERRAKRIFKNTVAAREGLVIRLR